ncbi:MAG: tape measure protein [Clostridiales bacterium]|nr:tape measure protein [Clostridiales bacterium]MDU1041599.1 tape measure protein [Clostridiales bacterium]
MASIQTAIQITDRVSAPMYNIIGALDNVIRAYDSVQSEFAEGLDTSKIQQARQQIDAAAQQMTKIASETNTAANSQNNYNASVSRGHSAMDGLVRKAIALAGTYASIQGAKKVLEISDGFVQTRARIDLMNDHMQSTDDLMNRIYKSAQNARGSFGDMAAVVAKFGNNARDAFSSSAEVVDFANLVQKQMTIAGASGAEASNAMLQLSQALGSGVLRGDELRSIFEQAPNLIQNIADYLNVPIGKIRDMAEEGELTADVVKNAVFASADSINEKFNQMPMTWGQVWTQMQNYALMAFQPILMKINEIANSPQFQTFIAGVQSAIGTLVNWIMTLFDVIGQFGSFLAANWEYILPVIGAVIAAIVAYNTVKLISNAITATSTFLESVHAAAKDLAAGKTFAATAAQYGYNAALMACPTTWLVLSIMLIVAAIFILCQWFAKSAGVANSAFGVMAGGINVVIQLFKNLGLSVANIGIAIGLSIAAVAHNMMTAFHNAIASIQSWFYNLLSTAITVVVKICEALNKLPFVKFDYSGISNAASDYASKAAAAQAGKGEYKDIAAEFTKGMNTFDTFQGDWAGDAFRSGAAWGDGVMDKLHGMIGGVMPSMPSAEDYDYQALQRDIPAAPELGDGGKKAKEIADNTAKTADALSITNEDLKYLRDLAEAEYVNKFTTAEIKIEQHNNNNISSDSDLDGIVDDLTAKVYSAMEMAAEGVY